MPGRKEGKEGDAGPPCSLSCVSAGCSAPVTCQRVSGSLGIPEGSVFPQVSKQDSPWNLRSVDDPQNRRAMEKGSHAIFMVPYGMAKNAHQPLLPSFRALEIRKVLAGWTGPCWWRSESGIRGRVRGFQTP